MKDRFLLDTHTLLWWLSDPGRLHPDARAAIANPRHQIYVSAASVWEMAIKSALGKLDMPDDLEAQLEAHRFEPLVIIIQHARHIETLPMLHRDPFDRMLIGQAQLENLSIITRDPQVQQYAVSWITA